MKRNVDVREISDGKLYTSSDLARTDTGGCINCGSCCHGMRDTIILDPYDIASFEKGIGKTAHELLSEGRIELGEADGLILPHLTMSGPEDACTFLDTSGRCSVHTCRPGFCRLYPMGRYYRDRDFRYILLTGECIRKNLTKIRVKKWLGIPDLPRYEQYIRKWHYFLVDTEDMLDEKDRQREELRRAGLEEDTADADLRRQACMYILALFFTKPYGAETDFYEEFASRMAQARDVLGQEPGTDP